MSKKDSENYKYLQEKLKELNKLTLKELIGSPPPLSGKLNSENLQKYSLAAIFAKNSQMKINQLRKFFTIIKDIHDNKSKDDIIKLYPLVAYAKGRNLISKEEAEIIYLILDQVKDNFDSLIEKFYQFFQAVVAYRKYLGG